MADGYLLSFLHLVHVPADLVQLLRVNFSSGHVEELSLDGLREFGDGDGVLQKLVDLQRRYQGVAEITRARQRGGLLVADFGGYGLGEVAAEALHLHGTGFGEDGRHGLVGQEHGHRVVEGVAIERRQLQFTRLRENHHRIHGNKSVVWCGVARRFF